MSSVINKKASLILFIIVLLVSIYFVWSVNKSVTLGGRDITDTTNTSLFAVETKPKKSNKVYLWIMIQGLSSFPLI